MHFSFTICSYLLFACAHTCYPLALLKHGSSYRQVFKNAMQNYTLLRKRNFVQQTSLHVLFDLIRALPITLVIVANANILILSSGVAFPLFFL